jgi:hypothetical protein
MLVFCKHGHFSVPRCLHLYVTGFAFLEKFENHCKDRQLYENDEAFILLQAVPRKKCSPFLKCSNYPPQSGKIRIFL